MNQQVEVKSKLYSECANCQAAIKLGLEQISRLFTPDIGHTPPLRGSDFLAIVECDYEIGTGSPEGIISLTKVAVNKEVRSVHCGPMDQCPAKNVRGQIPA